MVRRAARSRDSLSPISDQASPRSPDEIRSPLRQASVRRTPVGGSSGRGSGVIRRGPARARRPTPIVRRTRRTNVRNNNRLDEHLDEEDLSASDEELSGQPARRSGEASNSAGQVRVAPGGGRRTEMVADLCWYERLLPEFVLNLTAPLTGYETRVDLDVDEHEFEILERQRIRQNRRVRRRLLTLMVVTAAAGAFVYARGRLLRQVGAKMAANSLRNRIEDGLVKAVHETMGK